MLEFKDRTTIGYKDLAEQPPFAYLIMFRDPTGGTGAVLAHEVGKDEDTTFGYDEAGQLIIQNPSKYTTVLRATPYVEKLTRTQALQKEYDDHVARKAIVTAIDPEAIKREEAAEKLMGMLGGGAGTLDLSGGMDGEGEHKGYL